jgi:DNA-binding MarR family transcriptional regulator
MADSISDQGTCEGVGAIRRALVRNGLAFDQLRSALADLVKLSPVEVLALQYVAYAGELTPSQLGARLALSSGGSTALVQRLERAGCVLRDAHPDDRRKVLLRLAPEIQKRLADILDDLVGEIDAVTAELESDERLAVEQFLDHTAELSEGYAYRLRRSREEAGQSERANQVRPSLWA